MPAHVTSTSRTVHGLVEAGYVARRPSQTDGRQTLVDLTERGRAVLRADRRRRDAWLARRLEELAPDESALLRAVAPLSRGLATR